MDTTMSTPHDDNHPPRDELQPRGNDTSMRTTPQSTTDEDDNEEETIPPREAISPADVTVPNTPSSANPPLGDQVVMFLSQIALAIHVGNTHDSHWHKYQGYE